MISMDRKFINKKMPKVSQLIPLYGVILLLTVLTACGCGGGASSSSQEDQNNSNIIIQVPVKITGTDKTPPDINLLSYNLFDSLQLAAPGSVSPSSYIVNLANCTSGLTGNNSTAGSLNVYLHDTNCIAKLTSFVLYGTTYNLTNPGAVAFSPSTYAAGSTATFASSGGDLIYIKIVSQLSSPIQTTDEVSYNFTMNRSGTNSASVIVSSAQSITAAGQDAPNFKINSGDASLVGIVSSGPTAGAGLFSFNITCTVSAMTVGANPSYNSFCPTITPGGTIAGGASGVDIGVASNFSYKLIADPNNDGTLTIAQARATFIAGGDSTVTLSTDILAGNTGFRITSITGPTTIASTPKMILVLQAKNTNPTYSSDPNYSSFEYFPITLPTVNP